jgi:Zn-dependent protease with chaperone function
MSIRLIPSSKRTFVAEREPHPMKNKVRLFLFTLGLPILAFAMSWASVARLDSIVREQLHRQYPDIPMEKINRVTIAGLAAKGAFANTEIAATYERLKLARVAAATAGLLGLALLAAVRIAGRATRDRRDLLLRLFRPGLFITLTTVGLLTAAQAFAAAYSLYYFESIFFQSVHMILIIGVAIGGLLALIAVLRAMWSLLRPAEFRIPGEEATRTAQPQLWACVKSVCDELQAPLPDHIVLGLEPSFFVTESEVTLDSQKLHGRTLFMSLGLARVLTVPELRAIIGHEMAHFIGEDTVFSQRFFPVYRGTLAALVNLSRNAVHSSIAIAQLPAVSALGFFFESFAASEKNLSRQRETHADATGAQVAGSAALASALVKVHAYFESWKTLMEGVRFNAEELRAEPNLARAYGSRVAAIPAEALAKAGEKHAPHPFDSHPTLTVRLQALQTDVAAAAASAAVPAESESAAALIADGAALEERQSAALRRLVRPN